MASSCSNWPRRFELLPCFSQDPMAQSAQLPGPKIRKELLQEAAPAGLQLLRCSNLQVFVDTLLSHAEEEPAPKRQCIAPDDKEKLKSGLQEYVENKAQKFAGSGQPPAQAVQGFLLREASWCPLSRHALLQRFTSSSFAT